MRQLKSNCEKVGSQIAGGWIRLASPTAHQTHVSDDVAVETSSAAVYLRLQPHSHLDGSEDAERERKRFDGGAFIQIAGILVQLVQSCDDSSAAADRRFHFLLHFQADVCQKKQEI